MGENNCHAGGHVNWYQNHFGNYYGLSVKFGLLQPYAIAVLPLNTYLEERHVCLSQCIHNNIFITVLLIVAKDEGTQMLINRR